jgi:hypothetical protein
MFFVNFLADSSSLFARAQEVQLHPIFATPARSFKQYATFCTATQLCTVQFKS